MNVRRFRVDLAEARDARRNGFVAAAENVVEFDVTIEGQFGPGAQADRHARITLTAKAPGDRIPEAGGDEPIADFRRAGSNVFKAVITHEGYSFGVLAERTPGRRRKDNGRKQHAFRTRKSKRRRMAPSASGPPRLARNR
jgi:hypothetical protein